jgi:hypothetical protein
MKALVAKLSGKQHENDPVNIHAVVFWLTIFFWVLAGSCLAVVRLFF